MRRSHCFVRPVRKTDADDFTKWSLETENNLFDPDVVKYPTTRTFAAYNQDAVLVYVPVQRPYMMEALAINPEAGEIRTAQALGELVKFLVSQAQIDGTGEIYFVCQHEPTAEYAERHGFERVPYPLYRLKVKNTEHEN